MISFPPPFHLPGAKTDTRIVTGSGFNGALISELPTLLGGYLDSTSLCGAGQNSNRQSEIVDVGPLKGLRVIRS